MKKTSLLAIIGGVAVINLLSRLLGFFREVIIGYHFGTTMAADSIIAAYTIPNFLYITAGGAMTTAFISLYIKANRNQQESLTRVIFTHSFLFFSFISLAFFLFPKFWMGLFFQGLEPKQLSQTAELFRIMGLSTVFLVLSMFLSGLLNSHRQYRDSAWAPFLNNFIFIAAAVVLFPLAGIEAYATGALIGALGMFGLLVYAVRKYELFSFSFQWKIEDSDLMRRYLKIALPIFFGGATLQFYFLVHRFFASYLNEGVLAAINYASKLVQLPQTILMTAVTTVIYPLISKKIADNDRPGLMNMYTSGISSMLFLMAPATVYIMFFSEEIIQLIFEYGSFDASSTKMTSQLLVIFALGMFAHSGNVYVTRFFYAQERAMLPVISGIIAVFGVNIGLVLLFIEEAGAAAIAWGTTAAAYFQLALLMAASQRILGLKLKSRMAIGKIILATLLLALIGYILKDWLAGIPLAWFRAVSGGIVLAAVYLILAVVLKMEEIEKIPGLRRFKRNN
ncbi:putative peptidoglycan lipid II flippase [Bacillus ectoiniformans]|uniref:murein biosynthesis integral membrane protein MurJ n=1 Tax=Bacillus ectoiniformans TaxID=1494429 RepID=UPI00195EFA17|nr:putative peptidoglycan lipid II flippase [Bacillus ectoiniformans]